MRINHRIVALLAGSALVLAVACGPPAPPPLGGSPYATMDIDVVVNINGQPTCQASLGLFLSLDSDARLFMESDVLVRGAWAPNAACIYEEWGFQARLDCIGIPGGCGSWVIQTPNGDRGPFPITEGFSSRPHGAVLRVTFSAVWIGVGGNTTTAFTSTIACELHRCLFQPLS